MWSGVGLVLCCIVAAIALIKSKHVSGSYYAAEEYGMTPRSHRAYAVLSACFAAAFIAALFAKAVPAVPLLAAYVLVVVFYLSSFARGFTDEE